ncbi:MAG: hypothetical protein IT339_09665 [Thermomicrobiales bacterium]|nr:hypothetical protein [Thermomicrobiales bacterium]
MLPDWLHGLWGLLWRIKGTIAIQVVIITIGVLTLDLSQREHGNLLDHLGFDYDALTNWRFWHLLTGTWLQSSPGIAWSMIALVFGGTVALELLAGTGPMLVTCITGDWIATLLTAMTLRVLAEFGDASVSALLNTPDAGTSALAHAGYGAAVMLLPRRWLKVALPLLIVLTGVQFVLVSLAPAIVHCWAACYGALAGWFVLRPRLEGAGESRPDTGRLVGTP